MKEKVMQRAQKIVAGLVGSNKDEALAILSTSILIIATGEPSLKNKVEDLGFAANPNLIRKSRHRISKIDSDLAIKQYILGFNGYLTIKGWHQELVKRFGEKRAPSKSSIGRFLQKNEKQAISSLTGKPRNVELVKEDPSHQ